MSPSDKTAIAVLVVAGIGAYFLLRRQAAPFVRVSTVPVYGTGAALQDPVASGQRTAPVAAHAAEPGVFETAFDWLTTWGEEEEKTPTQWRQELLPLIRRQESAFAMPPGLLEAVAEKESAFRHDIIVGETLGGAGEEGIMQLKPQYHLSSFDERTNPRIAIPYAAKYLAQNFLRFGNWRDAVAAYNCGPTRLEATGIQSCPAVTRSYLAFVEARVGALA